MGGVTNGELDPTALSATKIDSATGQMNKYDAAFHGKLGFDKQVTKDFRVRLTGSFYTDHSANSNTLVWRRPHRIALFLCHVECDYCQRDYAQQCQ